MAERLGVTVEQVLKVLEDVKVMLDERQALHSLNAETHDANAQRMEERDPLFYKDNIALCRELSAQQRTLAADCDEKKRYIDHAIAIIKAAQEFKQAREDALDASDDNFEQAVARAEEKRDVLFSLLSPDQPKKEV